MFKDGYSFPHPVLGVGDDIEGEFNVSLSISRSEEKQSVYLTDISFEVDNCYINALIDSGTAEYLLKLYCGSTFQTWVYRNPKSLSIPETQLANRLELQALIVSKAELTNYSDSSFHPQFGDTVFSVGKNEVIGISGKRIIPINKLDEKLGLGNLFSFRPHKEPNLPMQVDTSNHKIEIIYPLAEDGGSPPSYLFKKQPWTAYNIFILPALEKAFLHIMENSEEAKSWEWFSILDNLLPENDREDDPQVNAQQVLEGALPVIRAYQEFQD